MAPVSGRLVRAQLLVGRETFAVACAQRSLAGRVLSSAWQRHLAQHRTGGLQGPQEATYLETPAVRVTPTRKAFVKTEPQSSVAVAAVGSTSGAVGALTATGSLTYVQAEHA